MRFAKRRAAATLFAAGLAGFIVVIAACTDIVTGDRKKNDAPLTPPISLISDSAPRLLAVQERRGKNARSFHQRNTMSWVGDAHNRGIEAYLADKRGRKFQSRNICVDIADFMDNRADVYPRHLPKLSREQRQAISRLGLSLVPCGSQLKPAAPVVQTSGWRLPPPQAAEPSQAARALFTEIGSSLDAAADPEQLAFLLNGVLDRSATLSPDEAQLVAAVASLTQSSYEYWTINYTTVGYQIAQEILADHPCLSSGDPISCDGTAYQTSLPLARAWSFSCGDAKASGKEIARADFLGGVYGAVYGGWATLGLSIIGSGVTASVGTMAWNVAVGIYCWIKK